MNREKYIKEIILFLQNLEGQIEMRGTINLRDINFICENFYRDFLNKVYNLNLINLNYKNNNNDTIDLGDTNQRICYQVTSSVTRAKVRKTIKGFNKHRKEYDELFMFFILPKKALEPTSGKISPFKSDCNFKVNKHLLDKNDLIKEIYNFDIDKLIELHSFITKELKPEESIVSKNENQLEDFNNKKEQLERFIINSSLTIGSKEVKGYNISKELCTIVSDKLSSEMVLLGRRLLHNWYDNIALVSYHKLFEAVNGFSYYDTFETDHEKLIFNLNSRTDDERWEYLKFYIDSIGSETTKVKEALSQIGSVNFYKVDFTRRQYYYERVMQDITEKYGVFTEGFINNIKWILKSISMNPKSKNLIEQIFNSHYDILLLFYLILGKEIESDALKLIKEYTPIDKIIDDKSTSLMIDAPSLSELEVEYQNALLIE